MPRLAVFVERVDLQPAVIDGESGRPDDRGDAGPSQVDLEGGAGDAFRVGPQAAGVRLPRQVEAVALDVRVGLIEQRQVAGVAAGDAVAEVRGEPHGSVVERDGPAEERDAAGGEGAEVDRVAAVRAADRDRDGFRAQRRGRGFPLSEDAEPPDEVTLAVPSRRALVRPDRQVDRTTRLT